MKILTLPFRLINFGIQLIGALFAVFGTIIGIAASIFTLFLSFGALGVIAFIILCLLAL
jgi:hypothetical protein